MRRPRNSPARSSNPLRDLFAERNRAAEMARARRRNDAVRVDPVRESIREDLPSLIDAKVGEQMDRLETKLVEGFKEMGQRVVEQSTIALTNQLEGRITQLEKISVLQTETINHLRDSSKAAEQKVSGVVNSIEKALSEAVPGFRLAPPSPNLPPQLAPPSAGDHNKELVKAQTRSVEDGRTPNTYCPKCTSANVRRATRAGMWEEFLRLFFIAPFRCRACRHKFYKF